MNNLLLVCFGKGFYELQYGWLPQHGNSLDFVVFVRNMKDFVHTIDAANNNSNFLFTIIIIQFNGYKFCVDRLLFSVFVV